MGKDLGVSPDHTDSKQYVKRQAAKYISDGRMLQGLSFPAKKTLENMAQDTIAKELRVITRDKTSPFRMKVNRKNIERFDWGDAVQKVAPTIVATLKTLLPFVSGGKRKDRKAAKR